MVLAYILPRREINKHLNTTQWWETKHSMIIGLICLYYHVDWFASSLGTSQDLAAMVMVSVAMKYANYPWWNYGQFQLISTLPPPPELQNALLSCILSFDDTFQNVNLTCCFFKVPLIFIQKHCECRLVEVSRPPQWGRWAIFHLATNRSVCSFWWSMVLMHHCMCCKWCTVKPTCQQTKGKSQSFSWERINVTSSESNTFVSDQTLLNRHVDLSQVPRKAKQTSRASELQNLNPVLQREDLGFASPVGYPVFPNEVRFLDNVY